MKTIKVERPGICCQLLDDHESKTNMFLYQYWCPLIHDDGEYEPCCTFPTGPTGSSIELTAEFDPIYTLTPVDTCPLLKHKRLMFKI